MSHHNHTEHNKTEHNKHEGHVVGDFLNKFWITIVLSVPIFFYSEMARELFNIQGPEFIGSQYFILLLGSIVFFYCGLVFISGAYKEIKARLPGMMTLISIAIFSAYIYSFFSVVFNTGHDLLFELSSLIAVMLLGHYIEMKTVSATKGALSELTKLMPDKAEVLRNGKVVVLPLESLAVGDVMVIRPGSKVPADGTVIEGKSELNESIITGESKPVPKEVNSSVIAGSINGDGGLKVKITKIGDDTFLAGIARLVMQAQNSKSRLQILSDRSAFYLTIIALISGGLTFILWSFSSLGISFAIERLVAVLVIACPHALGLAVPLVASISTTMAARNGLLVKQRLALEDARNIQVVLFDKTGTLTKGEFGVDSVVYLENNTENEVLKLAGSVNNNSEHSIAKAIVREAIKRNIKLEDVKNFERIAGMGAKALVSNQVIYVGNEELLNSVNVQIPQSQKDVLSKFNNQGKTIVYIFSDTKFVGSVALVDMIRSESMEAILNLKNMGIKVAMITGDSEDVARWASGELGIDQYFAKVLPNQKADVVMSLQKNGQKVAMVGDGVNDAPALTQANLGIAIGAGTNVAIESAGIILVKNDPREIIKIIKLSRLTYNKMVQNLFWATGYNAIAIPLAGGIFYSKGLVLEPAIAAIFMSLSTIIVAINAVLLRGKKLT